MSILAIPLKKTNILIIFGDHIYMPVLSSYIP